MTDTRTVEIVTIDIEERDGLFYLTSPDLPEIIMAHPDLGALFGDLPEVIRLIYIDRYGLDVIVAPAVAAERRHSRAATAPWAVIPAHIAAAPHVA